MANTKTKIKRGMGGSRGGRSRWEYTEVLKKESKKRRRRDDKNKCINNYLKYRD